MAYWNHLKVTRFEHLATKNFLRAIASWQSIVIAPKWCREEKGDSGNGSPRRWGWGIPLKKTIRHPNRIGVSAKACIGVNYLI
jgi:hypothetical protein